MPLQIVHLQIILKMEQITVPQQIQLKTTQLTTQQKTLQPIIQKTLKINLLIQIIPILSMTSINIIIIAV